MTLECILCIQVKFVADTLGSEPKTEQGVNKLHISFLFPPAFCESKQINYT